MNKSFSLTIVCYLLVDFSFAQNIPSTIRTEYLQIFIGSKNGTSITEDVSKGCVLFLIDSQNSIIEKDCESQKILSNIKLITNEITKSFENGWSKRFCGYDSGNPIYAPDGTIILTDFFTISYKDHKYEIFSETISGDISMGTRFFNL